MLQVYSICSDHYNLQTAIVQSIEAVLSNKKYYTRTIIIVEYILETIFAF